MDRRLALIEWLDADGQVRQSSTVTRWPATLGRSLDCDVVLDNPHVAALHATLDDGADGLVLTVGDTRNGVRVGTRRLAAGESTPLAPGALWQLGPLSLRVRLAREVLAPETPMPVAATHRASLATGGLALAALVWVAIEGWLDRTPGASWDAYLLPLLAAVAGAGLWSALWGVGSKLFRRHFEFTPHLKLLLGFVLAAGLIDAALALSAYMFSLPVLSQVRVWVMLALAAGLLAGHLARLLPAHRRALGVGVAAMLLLGIGIDAALNLQRQQRWASELYLATLPGPALRLAPARPPQALVDELRALQPQLERRVEEAKKDDAEPDDGEPGGGVKISPRP